MIKLSKVLRCSCAGALACAIGMQAMEQPCSSSVKGVVAADTRDILSDQELELAQAFHLAASSNAVDLMQDLLGQCADPTKVVNYIPDGSTDTPLIAAIKEGHTEAANLLIAYKADCMAPDTSELKGTPLYWAASKGYAGIVKELLSAGADKTVKTAKGETPCLVATRSKHLDVVRVLRGLELPVSASEKKVADAPQGLPYVFPSVGADATVQSLVTKDAPKDMPPAYQQNPTQEAKDLRGAPPAYQGEHKAEEKSGFDQETINEMIRQQSEHMRAEMLAAQERTLAEYNEKMRLMAEQVAQEKAERARLEQVRIEQEAAAKARADQEVAAHAKMLADQEARLKAMADQAQQERIERARLEQVRIEQEAAAKVRADQAVATQAKMRADQEAQMKALAEQLRVEQERAAKARAEQEMLAKQRVEQERATHAKMLADQEARMKVMAEQARVEQERAVKARAEQEARLKAVEHARAEQARALAAAQAQAAAAQAQAAAAQRAADDARSRIRDDDSGSNSGAH